MAKVTFSKLGLSLKDNVVEKKYVNTKGEEVTIEIKTYLPIEEKITMIMNIINQSIDNNGFYNPMRVKLYMVLEVVYAYTNLSFTEKMKEDPFKLYDILISTNIFDSVLKAISESDWEEIQDSVWDTIENIYNYKNSVMGILESVKADYSAVNVDMSELQENLGNTENLQLLRDIIGKLG